MRRLVLTLAILAAGGCGDEPDGGPRPAAQYGVLEVRETLPQGPIFIEGSLPVIRVVAPDGRVVVDEMPAIETLDEPVLRESLPPGRYELRTHQRPCNGNCGLLDAPTLPCAAPIEVRPGRTVVATIVLDRPRSGGRCRLQVSGG